MCIPRATVSAVSCLVVPAFICIDLLTLRVLKTNDDDENRNLKCDAGKSSWNTAETLQQRIRPDLK